MTIRHVVTWKLAAEDAGSGRPGRLRSPGV